MRAFFALFAGLTLSSCSTTTSQSDSPYLILQLRGQYQAIGACVYERIDRDFPGQGRITELVGIKTTRVSLESMGAGFGYTVPHRFYHVNFIEKISNQTVAEIRAVSYAETLHGENAKRLILQCAEMIQ